MSKIYESIGNRMKSLRMKNEISQEKLAEMLGISRPAVSQMENGERKITAEELIKISRIFGLTVENIINPQKEPSVTIERELKTAKEKPQIRINVPQKNMKKFREILLYILNKIGSKPNVGETVLYKLLYFIDFNFYEKYEEQLIGATYIKNIHGPTPVEFKKIVDKMIKDKEITRVKNNYFKYPQTKYLPLRNAELAGIKAIEIEMVDDVLKRLSDMTAKQVSEYSHKDVPWLTTEDGAAIEYESVFYRTEPYSVRKYD